MKNQFLSKTDVKIAVSKAEVEIVVSDAEVEVVNVSVAEVGIAVFANRGGSSQCVCSRGWYTSCVCNRGGSSRNCSIGGISIGGNIQVCNRGGSSQCVCS